MPKEPGEPSENEQEQTEYEEASQNIYRHLLETIERSTTDQLRHKQTVLENLLDEHQKDHKEDYSIMSRAYIATLGYELNEIATELERRKEKEKEEK